jgi:hypothetical protein
LQSLVFAKQITYYAPVGITLLYKQETAYLPWTGAALQACSNIFDQHHNFW